VRINKPDRNDVRGVAQMSCASQRGPARFYKMELFEFHNLTYF